MATTVAGVTNTIDNRTEPSIAEPSGHIQELIEDGDLDSATEEDTGALGCSHLELTFSGRHLRAKSSIDLTFIIDSFFQRPNPPSPTSVRSLLSRPGLCRPSSLVVASLNCAPPQPRNSGNPMARSHTFSISTFSSSSPLSNYAYISTLSWMSPILQREWYFSQERACTI